MINYFDFYEIPLKFNIDEKSLKVKFYKIAKENHPDFFINDENRYRQALSISATNNEAYKCLSDFYLRAAYILKLSDLIFDEKFSSDFLMDMMEINEAVEDLTIDNDYEKLKNLTSEIDKLNENNFTELSSLTGIADNAEKPDEKLLKQINETLQKHKYILRLKETLANIAPH
ncbi:MAG: Fe-S protein assembly co-chaperone HscB [Bacteroidetes bacterium]|nr:Fe-S protein assembly co-chaperone HscB [Bacteroidota bacterium]